MRELAILMEKIKMEETLSVEDVIGREYARFTDMIDYRTLTLKGAHIPPGAEDFVVELSSSENGHSSRGKGGNGNMTVPVQNLYLDNYVLSYLRSVSASYSPTVQAEVEGQSRALTHILRKLPAKTIMGDGRASSH